MLRAVVCGEPFRYPMLSEDAFHVVDYGTGGNAGELPNDWKLAVLVRYQEVLVSFELK